MKGSQENGGTLVLTATDVRELLDLPACIDAVERVLGLHAVGETPEPAVLGVHTAGGGFHVKAAAARLGRSYFAAKTNANFPDNPVRRGLPTIQGVIVLSDAEDGRPLAVLDSIEITTLRTGAATAVAARYLARPESATATIVGCGVQGRVQLRSLCAVLPIERVWALDADPERAARFAEEMTSALGVDARVGTDLASALRASDVCVTCTPSRAAFLRPDHLSPGTFVAGVGADNPEKHELDPAFFRDATAVVDVLEQARSIGDLHHAIVAGVVPPDARYPELGQVVGGLAPGRTSPDEVTVFDSTGTALQDVAAAAIVYERAVAEGRGMRVALA